MSTARTPEPGIYENIPFAEYLAWDAVSNSRLSLMAKSPRHYRHGMAKEPTPAMQLGSLYHCGILEPLMFADRYAICPDFHLHAENCTANGQKSTSTQTKYVKDRMEEFRALSEGREIVPRDWYDSAIAVVRELCANATASKILNSDGGREISLLWDDDGIACKARIDKLADGIIADVKSTADITAFTKAIGRYGYHRQMAHYQVGWHRLTGELRTPWLIAVESSQPHTVQAAPLHDEALEAGYAERYRLMGLLRECLTTDRWLGPPNPTAWHVPEWALTSEPIELIVNGETIGV